MSNSIWNSSFKPKPINELAKRVTSETRKKIALKKTKVLKKGISKLDKCPFCNYELPNGLAKHLTKSKECWKKANNYHKRSSV
ncbi:hypothetical protein H4J50_10130 [Colwellia sp. 6M3]|uniref:hypothetical protein n=1 Tax=Colwellia sp. 6M3 TaxID=2759849 RepID=UPI0015F57FF1|nr:hypothetical protein [Colwellia sp. 6M3]MBA6416372.1 hypothetical protein [Colwellia sp. 6M3]